MHWEAGYIHVIPFQIFLWVFYIFNKSKVSILVNSILLQEISLYCFAFTYIINCSIFNISDFQPMWKLIVMKFFLIPWWISKLAQIHQNPKYLLYDYSFLTKFRKWYIFWLGPVIHVYTFQFMRIFALLHLALIDMSMTISGVKQLIFFNFLYF